ARQAYPVATVVRAERSSALAASLAAIVVLAGSGGPNPTANVVSPSPSLSPATSPSPIPSPSPSPPPTPTERPNPITAPFPACTLPYVKPASLGSGQAALTGGFVSGKQGRWTADPAGVVDKAGDILMATRAKP